MKSKDYCEKNKTFCTSSEREAILVISLSLLIKSSICNLRLEAFYTYEIKQLLLLYLNEKRSRNETWREMYI